jgi:hypothetical protein
MPCKPYVYWPAEHADECMCKSVQPNALSIVIKHSFLHPIL